MIKKKHLTVRDLVLLLNDDDATMGEDVHCVTVIDGKEFPVVGVGSYDGIFCNIEVGLEMSQEGTERRGEEVFVAVE